MSYFQNSNETDLKKKANLWIVISTCLLLSNVMLVALCWYAVIHQKVEVTPFFGNQGYIKSDSSVDVHYLNQMAENFVLARLNVSPNNIKSNHARLLNYVQSKSYHNLSGVLLKERKHVIGQKISSYFDIESIVSNPSLLKSEVVGTLKRFVGMRQLADERAKYQLSYQYSMGRIAITQFKKMEVASHD